MDAYRTPGNELTLNSPSDPLSLGQPSLDETMVLEALTKHVAAEIREMGIGGEFEIEEKVVRGDKSHLAFPEAPVVALVHGGASGLVGLLYFAAQGNFGAINFLATPSYGGIAIQGGPNGAVFVQRSVILKDGVLRPVEFAEPIRVDALDFPATTATIETLALDASGVPLVASTPTTLQCWDKISTAVMLQKAGLPVPPFRVVPRAMTCEDQLIVRNELVTIAGALPFTEIVCKPNGMGTGSHVYFVGKHDDAKVMSAWNRCVSEGNDAIIQPRLVCGRHDRFGRPIDLNFRVLATWDGSSPYVAESMIEVRYRPLSAGPVNIARGANIGLVGEMPSILGISSGEADELVRKAIGLVEKAMYSLRATLNESVGSFVPASALLIGWDLQLGPQDTWYFLEANSGPVGGGSKIEKLSQTKGGFLNPVGRLLTSLAIRHQATRSPSHGTAGRSVNCLSDAFGVHNLAALLCIHGARECLESEANRLLKASPPIARARHLAAVMYMRAGHGDQALEVLRGVTDMDDDVSAAMCLKLRGYILRSRDAEDDALLAFEAAYQRAPYYPSVQAEYAYTLIARSEDNFSSALRIFEQALLDAPYDIPASCGQIFALFTLGRDDEAFDHLSNLIALDQENEVVWDFVADILMCLPSQYVEKRVSDNLLFPDPTEFKQKFAAASLRAALRGGQMDGVSIGVQFVGGVGDLSELVNFSSQQRSFSRALRVLYSRRQIQRDEHRTEELRDSKKREVYEGLLALITKAMSPPGE